MSEWMRRSTLALAAAGAVLLWGVPAQAVFLGLEPGDVLDTVGYTIPVGGGAFADAADTLDIDGTADDITTTTPEVLTEVGGGAIAVNLDLAGETLLFLGDAGTGGLTFVYQYSATFTGRAGLDDVSLFAPTGGPAPEQDGRLLISGEFVTDPTVSVDVTFDTAGLLGPPSFTITGTFDVTGGDPTFQSAFGSTGSLADIIGITSSSVPSVATLLTDGYLFSSRDTDLGAGGCGSQAAGTLCLGNVVDQSGSFTFSGNGEIVPQSPSAFVPEPGTAWLMLSGLLGLGYAGRKRGLRQAE